MLYVVATPIGNLGDITYRAVETLKAVALIAAEDTRHSGKLLKHYAIETPQVSYHEHNESRQTPALIAKLADGIDIALISDAGTPGISDPGYRLVNACIAAELPYTVLPGPSSLTTAAVGCGFGGGKFFFGGFLAVKSGRRENELRAAGDRLEFTLFLESPHRLVKSLEALSRLLPTRRICVARELTKHFEEFRHGIAPDLLAHYTAHPPKGEIVLAIEGISKKEKRQKDAASKY